MTLILDDPYASHLPVLEYFRDNVKGIKKVVEFGCGIYSTKTFLQFPELNILHSFDISEEWCSKVKLQCADKRLVMTCCTEWEAAQKASFLWSMDLIFIDGNSAKERYHTASMMQNRAPFITLHDAENPIYQRILDLFKYKFIYNAITPHTAVLSNSKDLSFLNKAFNI